MRRFWPWLLGVVSTAVVLRRAVFSADSFLARDMLRGHLPLKLFAADQWRQGRLGDWYPFDGFGESNSGMVVSWPFHPANLVFLPLETAFALKLLVLLSHVFAVAGVCFWLQAMGRRAWVSGAAAIAYAFCGYLVSINNNVNYLIAAATVPWLAWAGWSLAKDPRPRTAAAAGVLLGSLALAGEPQAFVVGAALLTVQWISVRGFKPGWLLAAGAIAGGVGAIQILPALGIRSALRAGQNTLANATQFAGHPLKALELFFGPLFLTESGEVASVAARKFFEPLSETLWVETQYLSPLVMAFALVAVWKRWREQKWMIGAWAVIFLLWLGPHTPVYGLFFDWLPLWGSFRYPEKLTPWLVLGLCMAASEGLTLLGGPVANPVHPEPVEGRTPGRTTRTQGDMGFALRQAHQGLPLATLGVLCVGAIACLLASGTSPLTAHFSAPALQSLGLLLAAGLIIWRAPKLKDRALPALLAAPVLLWSGGVYLLSPASVFAPTPLVKALPSTGRDDFRVSSSAGPQAIDDLPAGMAGEIQATLISSALRPNTPGIWGLSSTGAYFAGATSRVLSLPADQLHTARFEVKRAQPGLSALATDETLQLVLTEKRATPRARLISARCVLTQQEASDRIREPNFDAEKEAVLECPGPRAFVEEVRGTVTPTWLPYDAPSFSVQTETGGVLVLDDAYYPGWTARLDGEASEIFPANVAFRGVAVPPGTHKVDFRFRTPGVVAGAWVTLVSILAALGLALWRR